MKSDRAAAVSAWALGALLAIAILAMWVPGAWINPSLFQAGLFALAGGWAVQTMRRPGGAMRGGLAAWAALAGAAMWGAAQLGSGQTVSRWETETAVLGWAGNLAAFFVATRVGAAGEGRRVLQGWMLGFAFAISVVSLLQHFSAPGKIFWFYETGGDAFGPFENRDRYAAFAELVFPLAMAKAMGGGRMARFAVGVCATLFAAVIAGASRAGGFLMAVEAAAVLWQAGRGGRFARGQVRKTAAKLAAAAGVFTAVVGAGVLMARYADTDFSDRRAFVESSIAMVRERPWFGFGLGNFENAYPRYARIDLGKIVNHAHNDWAEWAADGGLPFVGLMAAFAMAVGPKAFRSVWGMGILGVMAHSLVDFPLQAPAIEFWFFTMAGAVMAEGAGRRAAG